MNGLIERTPSIDGAVLYTSQSLTAPQAAQALLNLSPNGGLLQTAGAIAACAYQVRSPGMGLWSPSTNALQIQANNDGVSGAMIFNPNVIQITGDTAFQVAYKSGVTSAQLSLGLHTYNAGLGVVSDSEWYAVSGSSKVFSVLNGGLQIESGKTLRLGNTAVSETITPDKTIVIYDETGTAYKAPVVAQ